MRKLKWLVVWGSAFDQIRFGEGRTEKEAMKHAFGMSAANMTAIHIPGVDVKVMKRRQEHIKQLLIRHKIRFQTDKEMAERNEGEKVLEIIQDYIDKL